MWNLPQDEQRDEQINSGKISIILGKPCACLHIYRDRDMYSDQQTITINNTKIVFERERNIIIKMSEYVNKAFKGDFLFQCWSLVFHEYFSLSLFL